MTRAPLGSTLAGHTSAPGTWRLEVWTRFLVGGYGDHCHDCGRRLATWEHQWCRAAPGGGHHRICERCKERREPAEPALW